MPIISGLKSSFGINPKKEILKSEDNKIVEKKIISKNCKNANVNSLKTKCNLIETKTICEKNHKNILKKLNNQKNNTIYKKFLHTFYKKYNNSELNFEEKKILNKINKLNNKIFPKYTLTYINIENFEPIKMHIIDFLIDPFLYNFMNELNIYMEKVNKKILCSKNKKYNNNLCSLYKENINILKNKECDIICIKNKYFLNFILDKLLTLDLYQLLLIILKRFNESFNNIYSYNENGKKYSLFKMNGNNIEIDFFGLTYFIYSDLQPFLVSENCSYIVKLIINIISYYIDNMYRHRDSTKSISKEQIDKIKTYAKFVDYLPKCTSLTHLKKEINKYIITKIANKNNKGGFIDISKLDFWYDIPKLVIKILGESIISSVIHGKVEC
jgi:hypothetical protein